MRSFNALLFIPLAIFLTFLLWLFLVNRNENKIPILEDVEFIPNEIIFEEGKG